MTTLHIDFETRSTVDLKKTGVHVYAGHPTTDIWCMAYALAAGLVALWTPGTPPPEIVTQHIRGKFGPVIAHNAAFEWCIWNAILVPRYGFPPLAIEQCHCTMAMARAMSLPPSLAEAALAVGLPEQKDMDGRRLMLQMAKPRRIEKDKIVWWDTPDRLERLYAYCRQDVEAERALEKRLVPLSAKERQIWLLDQKINNRGVMVDLKTIDAAEKLIETSMLRLNARMAEATGGAVTKCSQVYDLTRWVAEQGIEIDSLAKADVTALLCRTDLPPAVREALLLRQEGAKTSTAKLKKMREGASADHRLRGLLGYHVASTGRWGGYRTQPHNLPRPSRPYDEILDAIEMMDAA